MIKLLKDETVFIPLKEIEKEFPDFLEFAKETEIKIFNEDIYGDVVEEADYNKVIQIYNETVSEGKKSIELTKVNSLSFKVNESKKMTPLKMLFLSSFMNERQIASELEKEEKEELDRFIKEIKNDSSLLKKYNSETSLIKDSKDNIEKYVNSIGLELQFVTEINANSVPGLMCFLAGKDIFYSLYIGEMNPEDFETFTKDENGNVIFFDSLQGEDTVIKPCETNRDFRNYSPLENLAWCFKSLDVSNDFNDEINYNEDGIYFSANIPLILSMFNNIAFKNYHYENGIIDFSEKIISPQ